MKIVLDARYLNQGWSGIATYIENLLRNMLAIDPSFEALLITRQEGLPARFDAERCIDFVFNVEPRSLRTVHLLPHSLKKIIKDEGVSLFHGPFHVTVIPDPVSFFLDSACKACHDFFTVRFGVASDPFYFKGIGGILSLPVRLRHYSYTRL